MPHRKTQINVLPGNGELMIVKTGYMGVINMAAIAMTETPVTIELLHNGTAVRQEDDGFGTMVDVYRVEQVYTVNETDVDYHLVINSGPNPVYEDQLHSGREMRVTLPPEHQFESSQLGYSLSTIR